MASTIHARFGHRLRELRAERGVSQSALAERAEVTPEYVSRIERGRVGPSLVVIQRIATALGVEPKALFEFKIELPAGDATAKRIEYLIQEGTSEQRQLLLRLAETVVRWKKGTRGSTRPTK
jgi:transcriptional regulator with XRE-family HTH domain